MCTPIRLKFTSISLWGLFLRMVRFQFRPGCHISLVYSKKSSTDSLQLDKVHGLVLASKLQLGLILWKNK